MNSVGLQATVGETACCGLGVTRGIRKKAGDVTIKHVGLLRWRKHSPETREQRLYHGESTHVVKPFCKAGSVRLLPTRSE